MFSKLFSKIKQHVSLNISNDNVDCEQSLVFLISQWRVCAVSGNARNEARTREIMCMCVGACIFIGH